MDWTPYLQSYEPQSFNYKDTDECSDLGGFVSPLEIYFNWKKANNQIPEPFLNFLLTNGYWNGTSFAFSERYFGIKDGTTIYGNLMQNGYKAFPTVGIIPRSMLEWTLAEANQYPTEQLMDTSYYDPSVITPAMDELAQQFLSYIQEFEWGFVEELDAALDISPVGIAIPIPNPTTLWNEVNVPYTGGTETDHCVCLYKIDNTQENPYFITDQYQPFQKQLASNYDIPVAIAFSVIFKSSPSAVPITVTAPKSPTWFWSIINNIKSLIK